MEKFAEHGIHIVCDRCKTVVAYDVPKQDLLFLYDLTQLPWKAVMSPLYGRGAGRRLDFCDEQCRVTFFKGRKYWERKMQHQRMNAVYDYVDSAPEQMYNEEDVT